MIKSFNCKETEKIYNGNFSKKYNKRSQNMTMVNSEFIPVPHIGEILNEEFLEPLNITQNALAVAIGVPTNRINAIVRGQRGITADTDLRLTKYFGLTKGYFLRLQSNLELLEQGHKIEKELSNIVPFRQKQTDVGIAL